MDQLTLSMELPHLDFQATPRCQDDRLRSGHCLSVSVHLRRELRAYLISLSTYGMNILQHLPESKHGLVLVTLNPPFPVDPAKTIGSWTYTHPMMTTTSVSTQPHLPSIQNKRNISYAGAWTKYGFHEDGFTSGMRLVTGAPFNVKPPFPLLPATRSTEQSGVGLAVGKGVVNALESSRRFLTPAWGVVEWTVVLGLVWLEQVFGALGLDGTKIETRRVRDAWRGKVSAERKSQ